jgi:hypothetical protein
VDDVAAELEVVVERDAELSPVARAAPCVVGVEELPSLFEHATAPSGSAIATRTAPARHR